MCEDGLIQCRGNLRDSALADKSRECIYCYQVHDHAGMHHIGITTPYPCADAARARGALCCQLRSMITAGDRVAKLYM